MDPWLEQPALWPEVHNLLVAELKLRLTPILRPRYVVALQERTYLADERELLVGLPDAAVVSDRAPSAADRAPAVATPAGVTTVEVPTLTEARESYLEVREPETREVITALELLSPSNKLRSGEGRSRYEEKRRRVLSTRTHLVEVDLVRAGEPMRVYGADPSASDYRILVSRGDQRPTAQLHAFSVRDPIPAFALPLRPDDEEPRVGLNAVLHEVYDRAAWDMRVDYGDDPIPRLRADAAAWADEVLRAAGRRADAGD